MHRENVQALINRLRSLERVPLDAAGDGKSGFNMATVHYDCGTPACIAGWAAAVATGIEDERAEEVANDYVSYNAELSEKDLFDLDIYRDMIIAADFLGLDREGADRLFFARGINSADWELVQPADAIKVLENFLETGGIDWSSCGLYQGEEL